MTNRQTPKNNILFFFCDQLRIDLLGCYGSDLVRTPNIDSLANESVVFDRAYTPCAICSPARASLMTGLYPHGHHMFNNSTPHYSYCEHLRPGLQMLPDWTRENTGYETAYFGKWHIGPADDLFNSSFHHTHPRPDEGDLPFLDSSHWHPDHSMGTFRAKCGTRLGGTIDVPMDRFPDVAAANYTREFLRRRGPDSPPFLAFCAFPGPHGHWLVPEEFGIRYDPETIPLWPNRHDPLARKPVNQKKLRLLAMSRVGASRDVGDDELRGLMACCFSYLELIDGQVGHVIAELKKAGAYDNTTIVFTADHGDMAGAHGFMSKGSYMYDEIYRIPMLVRPAGGGLPKRVDAPVNLMDLTATLMHVMQGAPVDSMASHSLHGQSLVPLIGGSADWERPVHYAQYHGDWYGHYSARMVTDGKWKLVWNFSDFGELYDLVNDPGELSNLFYDTDRCGIRQEYLAILASEAARLGDQQAELLAPMLALEERVPREFDAGIETSSDLPNKRRQT